MKIKKNQAEEAGDRMISELAECHAMIDIFDKISYYLINQQPHIRDEERMAISKVRNRLFDICHTCWGNIATFSPAHVGCQKLTTRKLRKWFEKDDAEIASYAKGVGIFTMANENEFRQSVLNAIPDYWANDEIKE